MSLKGFRKTLGLILAWFCLHIHYENHTIHFANQPFNIHVSSPAHTGPTNAVSVAQSAPVPFWFEANLSTWPLLISNVTTHCLYLISLLLSVYIPHCLCSPVFAQIKDTVVLYFHFSFTVGTIVICLTKTSGQTQRGVWRVYTFTELIQINKWNK